MIPLLVVYDCVHSILTAFLGAVVQKIYSPLLSGSKPACHVYLRKCCFFFGAGIHTYVLSNISVLFVLQFFFNFRKNARSANVKASVTPEKSHVDVSEPIFAA